MALLEVEIGPAMDSVLETAPSTGQCRVFGKSRYRHRRCTIALCWLALDTLLDTPNALFWSHRARGTIPLVSIAAASRPVMWYCGISAVPFHGCRALCNGIHRVSTDPRGLRLLLLYVGVAVEFPLDMAGRPEKHYNGDSSHDAKMMQKHDILFCARFAFTGCQLT